MDEELKNMVGVFPRAQIVARPGVKEDVLFPPGHHGVEEINDLFVCEATFVKGFLESFAQFPLRAGLRQSDPREKILDLSLLEGEQEIDERLAFFCCVAG